MRLDRAPGLPPELRSREAYLEAWCAEEARRVADLDEALASTLLFSVSAAHLLRTGDGAGLARMGEGVARAAALVRAGLARAPALGDAIAIAQAVLGTERPLRTGATRLRDPLVPPPARLPEALARLGEALARVRRGDVRAACEAHIVFAEVHPLADANGRAGRIVLAWQIADERGRAPRLRLADREAYLEAVRRRDARALVRIALLRTKP